MSKKGNCNKYETIHNLGNKRTTSDIKNRNMTGNITTFICNDGKVINTIFINDLVFDCGLEGEDEPVLMSWLKYDQYSLCTEPDMKPCIEGHSKCCHTKDICIYKINPHNSLIPCRNGGHLQNCKNVECDLMFKCINSYCVPWAYVCNRNWDCPEGNDELNNPVCNSKRVCIHMYKYKNISQRCIHVGNICDGNNYCPLGYDEHLCELKNIKCPLNCN